jgi:hypothetical protein
MLTNDQITNNQITTNNQNTNHEIHIPVKTEHGKQFRGTQYILYHLNYFKITLYSSV